MRGPGTGWGTNYSKHFIEACFKKGVSAPTVFYNEERQLKCVVNGDDFACLGFV